MRLLRRALARVADAAARATAVETRAESIASGPGLRSGRQHRTATSSALGVEPIAWAGSARSTFSSAMKATRRIPSGTPGASYASSGAAASAVSARRLGGFAVSGVRSEGTARGLPGQERASAWAMAHTRGYAKEAVKTMKVYKPTSPGQRGRITTARDHLWKGKPFKALTKGLTKSGGRNNRGRITVFHRGGGHKRKYRMIDFQRLVRGVTGTVRRIEYDPNRTTRIALVDFENASANKPAYVLATDGMSAGDVVRAGDEDVDIRPGNAMPLGSMPAGTLIHNIELLPGQGGRLVRAAGATATLVKKGEDGYATVKLPSGEQRLVLLKCYATVGVLSNKAHQNRVLGKAGAKRWLGIRPTTRGVAMNPIDHPHGGGEGRTSGGRPSCTPWGVQTKGHRTRNNKRTDAFRVARRPSGKKKK